jgi:hypothetical protein
MDGGWEWGHPQPGRRCAPEAPGSAIIDGMDVVDGAAEDAELLTFDCPRCATSVTEPYYGPCSTCRTTLRALIGGEAREVEDVAYEPKMNVTPNAVALKE